jgi:2'-5' RNA ligase
MMAGLVSLLDKTHFTRVTERWQELDDDCGLKDISMTPLPHFSWHVAEDYDWPALGAAMQEIAAAFQPFTVWASGLGLFTDKSPVVYIPIVRTKALSEYHQTIWDRLTPLSTKPSAYYGPSSWIPHITLAYGDVDANNLPCLMNKLAFSPIFWEINIDNLTMIHAAENIPAQIRYQNKLGEKKSNG